MIRSQAKVFAGTLIILASLLLIAGLLICILCLKGPSEAEILCFLVFLCFLGGAVILVGLGLFVLKGKKKSNNDK